MEYYNNWFMGKVIEALNSTKPTRKHKEVISKLRKLIKNEGLK